MQSKPDITKAAAMTTVHAKPRRRPLALAALLLPLTLLSGLALLDTRGIDAEPHGPSADDHAPRRSSPEVRAADSETQPDPGPRTTAAADDAAPSAPATFAERLDAIVASSLRSAELMAQQEHAAAQEVEEGTRAAFVDLVRTIADSDALALAEFERTPADDPDADEQGAVNGITALQVRKSVLQMLVRIGLERRHAAERDGQPASSALTTGILTALLGRADLAEELGAATLCDQPYLALAHEALVLELVQRSGEGRFPPAVATGLLATLWRNLAATGARSSDQLAGLALLLLENGNLSERMASARTLLHDDRYRAVLLDLIDRNQDRQLAHMVGLAAAQELAPAAAMAVLQRTARHPGTHTASFVALARRDPAMLQRRYEQLLGDDRESRLRAMMVTGSGFAATDGGLEVARLAMASDPDPEVRLRAMFALTARAAEALGEQAILDAIEDPRIGGDGLRLASVVAAFQNLANAGMVNAVHRLGLRLRECPALGDAAREQLEELLGQSLPRGGSQ